MSRRESVLDALVVGGGAVGAAAALGLARAGLAVALLDAREPRPWRADSPDLRVFALANDSMGLLDTLGVGAGIRATRAVPYRRMRVWDAAGGDPLVFDADALGAQRLGHLVENALLVDALWAAMRAQGLVLRAPATVQAISPGEDRISVTLDSGQTMSARWLFAADGSDSAVRALAGIGTRDCDYHQEGLVAFLESEHGHAHTCWQRFLAGGPLALLPWQGRQVSIVWSLPDGEAERLLGLPEAAFEREVTRASDGVLGRLRLASSRVGFPLQRRLADRMLAGRVALLGDAAHAVHPLAGQGVNLGFRDVAALLEEVSSAQARRRLPLSSFAMQRWSRRRWSDNALGTYGVEAIHRVFTAPDVLPTLLRGHLLGVAGYLPPLQRALWARAGG